MLSTFIIVGLIVKFWYVPLIVMLLVSIWLGWKYSE